MDASASRDGPYPYSPSGFHMEGLPAGYPLPGPLPGCPQHEAYDTLYSGQMTPEPCEPGMPQGSAAFHAPFGFMAPIAEVPSHILSTSPTTSPQHCRSGAGVGEAGMMPRMPTQGFPPMSTIAYGPAEVPMDGARYGKQRGGQGRWGPQKAQESHINQMKNNEITRKEPPWTDVTTVMMRNLPNKYTQQMLLEELHFNGFRLQYDFDFFYLPMDHSNAVNLGYCFINFVETRIANAFAANFSGKRMRRFNSSKTVIVMPASIQGFERNYAYYASTRVAQAEDPQYRPIFMRGPSLQEACHFQPAVVQIWEQQEVPYMDPQQAWAFVPAKPQAGEREATPEVHCASASAEQVPASSTSASGSAGPSQPPPFPESLLVARSHRLVIRNTFLDAPPERSPSVERFLEERQVKSCPVSLPQSEAGSAKIECGPIGSLRNTASGPNLINFAVVAAASGLAQNLGCVAPRGRQYAGTEESSVDESSGEGRMQSSRGSTMDSMHGAANPRQVPSSSCGSAELQTNATTPSELEGPVLGSPELPCKGSSLHRWGACKPCAFHYQAESPGCKNGVECPFCHLCEPGEKKRRKKERQAIKREHREHAAIRKVDGFPAWPRN